MAAIRETSTASVLACAYQHTFQANTGGFETAAHLAGWWTEKWPRPMLVITSASLFHEGHALSGVRSAL